MNALDWIRSADPSLDYLVDRDLCGIDNDRKRMQIGVSGWCREYIKNRNADGGWGNRFYQPKWICTHYTALELRNLEYPPTDERLRGEINRIGYEETASDGGINPSVTMDVSDTCVTAMYLDYAVHFAADAEIIRRTVDYILENRMDDGGYNCDFNQSGASHGSLHTSVCVLEAFQTYLSRGHQYRIREVAESRDRIIEFMLEHELFRSSRSREVIDGKMLAMTYPFRWKYTVLRALNAFVDGDVDHDGRMDEAISIIEAKRLKDGRWKMQSRYPGKVFFELEEAGEPSRIMTYLALKILRRYRGLDPAEIQLTLA